MPHADFVHLRVHTAYSLSEGAIQIKDLVTLCQAYAMPAVAITDTGNLFGALEFSEACAKGGVQPLIGAALALVEGDWRGLGGGNGRRHERAHLVLLAQDQVGYANLMKLSTAALFGGEAGEPPALRLADLEDASAGLIVLSGGAFGPLGRLLQVGQGEGARKLAHRLATIFPDRFYIEVQRHGMAEERCTEAAFVDLAWELALPLVATNEPYFADPSMFEAHDALLCIEQRSTISRTDRRRLTPDHAFKSAEVMRALFADLPEAADNTLVVARRCAFRPTPRAPILPVFPLAAGRGEADALTAGAEAGLRRRLDVAGLADGAPERRPYEDRLAFELGVIVSMGFAGYFLIVADFVRYAREQGIPVGPGRGSGAGSLVAWALGITDLDPLRFGLLFERFLNPDRISMPDFDIDFCQNRRDEVIHYVQRKYGRDRVAQIITFGKLQARAALRDVGRVLDLPYNQVDRLCKLVPYNPANPVSLAQAIESEPRLREERDRDEAIARLIEIALKLEGLYRHASTHAAGIVIGDRPVAELVPLYRDPRSDVPATQFSMKYVELAGLTKFDFLGLKTLSVLERARTMLAARGLPIEWSRLPLDDARTYAMLQRAESVGVFQFESPGMRDLLRDAQPSNIEDLIALVALYRPGPMENIPKYVACKRRREEPEFLHETIAPVVKDTYGVILYQEQVMQIAQVFAGYTLGQADVLRRAMGKKIKSEMDAQRETFVQGATGRGVAPGRAVHVFELVAKFAGYGFNKAHSAGYALVAYQTAYLKANHPLEFFAASMSLELNSTDKLAGFRRELERLGIALLAPDINRSEVGFVVEAEAGGGGAIRYALAAIRNVGEHAMAALVAERKARGPFRDLFDFAARLDARVVNRRQLENLVCAGAFDSLNPRRAQVFTGLDIILRHAGSAAPHRDTAQASLFEEGASAGHAAPALPEIEDWLSSERLSREFEAIGFCLSAHPLDAYQGTLRRLAVLSCAELASHLGREDRSVRLAGTVHRIQERRSGRGNRYAIITLSDPTGQYEVTAFSEVVTAARDLLRPGTSLLVGGDARLDGEGARIVATSLRNLATEAARAATGLLIRLDDPAALSRLKEILGRAQRGRGRVTLNMVLDHGAREVEIALPGGFALSPDTREAISALRGIGEVRDV
ncbi:MAG: DNA polymerase III subunit alpha [Alphaproteobacteria bacterium]|nr:DNA polymerase III subunit alpha [Alphaproteobacteria bacterium]